MTTAPTEKTEPASDAAGFLTVFAALLLDNVVHLEKAVGRVTDLIVASGQPGREMIVSLQSFDRLKQEFEALGGALTRYAEATSGSSLDDGDLVQLERQVISGITVADLKERLLSRLRDDFSDTIAPQVSEQELALVGVDVVY